VPISRLCTKFTQSRDHAISVACTIEPFEFPLCIKVRNVHNELLQLCHHHQPRACTYTQGPAPGTSGKFANSEKLSSPRSRLGTGSERSQTCGVPPFMASPSWRVLNSLPIVSSDTLTSLVHCIHKLHTCNPKIVQTYCAVSRLAAQSLDSENATLSLCKFLDCVEHKHDTNHF